MEPASTALEGQFRDGRDSSPSGPVRRHPRRPQGEAGAGQARCDAVAETGAGFAGGAVWGLGQGPHSHDMFARVDLETTPRCPTSRASRGSPPTSTSTTQPHPYCPRVNLRRVLDRAARARLCLQRRHRARVLPGRRDADGSIARLGPARRRRPGQALLRLSRGSRGRWRSSASLNDGLEPARLGRLPGRPRGRQLPVRDQLRLCRRPDDRRPPHLLPDDGRPARPAARGDRHLHGQAVRRPDRLGGAHALSPRRSPRPARTSSPTRPTRAAWASRSWPTSSSAASWRTPRRSARSPRRRSTATSGSRWGRP